MEEVEKVEIKNKRGYKKVLVYGDIHYPYQDERALNILYEYMKDYKPDAVVILGDVVDFYSISDWDKNPDHFDLQYELDLARDHLRKVRKIVGKQTRIYYLEGNHEARLQRYVYRHPELEGLDVLNIKYLLDFDKYKIEFKGADVDYWKKDNGHLKLGNVLLMHGDNRLNGASNSKYSGYSVKNTILGATQMNTIIGHVHRLSMFYHKTPTDYLVGMEAGSLCQEVGTANWQQGFVTFELYRGKMINPRTHHIVDGVMYDDGKVYKG